MSCPNCGQPMFINGSYWQCNGCGNRVPVGVVPDTAILLPMAAR